MKIDIDTIKELIRFYENDREIIDFIYEAMMSFSKATITLCLICR